MTKGAIVIAAALLLATGAGATDRPALQPTGTWVVDYAEGMCVLSHGFGDATRPLLVAFRPWPLDHAMDLIVQDPGKRSGDASMGEGSVTFEPSGERITTRSLSWNDKTRGDRISSLALKSKGVEALPTTRSITLRVDGHTTSIALPDPTPALAALQTCEDDLLRHWGVDPVAERAFATPARPINKPAWFDSSDYPSKAANGRYVGPVHALLTIDPAGAVTDCRVTGSSGTPELDQATCALAKTNGHYTPARDASGAAAVAHDALTVIWTLG